MFWEIEEVKKPTIIIYDEPKKSIGNPPIYDFLERRKINRIFKIEFDPNRDEWQEFIKTDIKFFYKKIIKLSGKHCLTNNIPYPTGIILNYKKYNNVISLIVMNDLTIWRIENNEILKPKEQERIQNFINIQSRIKHYKSKILSKILNTKPYCTPPIELGNEIIGNLYLKNVDLSKFPIKKVNGKIHLNNSKIYNFNCESNGIVKDSNSNIFK